MKKLKHMQIPIIVAAGILLVAVILGKTILKNNETPQTESVAIRPIASEILASGSVKSENEATLHFQTGGKLVYLPFKKGDKVNHCPT